MRIAVLTEFEDFEWVRTVHQIDLFYYSPLHKSKKLFELIMVYGNEDWPDRIELYPKDHYRSDPWVYEPNEEGTMVLVREGSVKLKRKKKS